MIMASAIPASSEQTSPAPTSCLLDVLQRAAAERGHSVETIRAYWDWTTWFILFHGKRHPRDLTNAEVGRFLGHVAQTDKDALRASEAAGATGEARVRPATLPWKLFEDGNRDAIRGRKQGRVGRKQGRD